MKFYTLDGNEIDRAEFVRKYGNSYYIDRPRCIPRVGQSSRTIEDYMDELLKNGVKESLDVVRILAWKLGKIKHSESKNGFVYAKDWKNAERFEAYRYNRPLDIRTISEYIANNITRLEETAMKDPQEVLCELRDMNITGLGTVYLITLLYFISCGKYPIYDRFAWMAVQAICGDKKPGEAIAVTELPWKNSHAFERVFDTYMVPFMEQLESVFGTACQECRDVDRALWVYGHAFRVNR